MENFIKFLILLNIILQISAHSTLISLIENHINNDENHINNNDEINNELEKLIFNNYGLKDDLQGNNNNKNNDENNDEKNDFVNDERKELNEKFIQLIENIFNEITNIIKKKLANNIYRQDEILIQNEQLQHKEEIYMELKKTNTNNNNTNLTDGESKTDGESWIINKKSFIRTDEFNISTQLLKNKMNQSKVNENHLKKNEHETENSDNCKCVENDSKFNFENIDP